jgi:hypothetical protein
MRMMKTYIKAGIILGFAFLLAACQSEKSTPTPGSIFPDDALTPFATITLTQTVTATPMDAPTATLAPTLTPTPGTYQVKANDTLFVIAYRNGITVDELKAANPDVDPYLLTSGMTLLIPAPKEVAATQSAPNSTPYPITVYTPNCLASLSGGLYCYVQIKNEQSFALENITGEFMLTNPQTGEVVSQKALLPLSQISSGNVLPLFAYFPAPADINSKVTVQFQTAMMANANNPQTIQATITQPEIKIAENGLSAVVNAQAKVEGSDTQAGKLWIAAVAFNAEDKIIGIRRYESPTALQSGEEMAFSLNVYSIGGKIVRVDLYGEAIP